MTGRVSDSPASSMLYIMCQPGRCHRRMCMKPIGKLIHDRLKEREQTVKEFAEAIGYQRSNAYRIFNQTTIDTGLLMRISVFLEHDFFADYSAEYQHTAADAYLS